MHRKQNFMLPAPNISIERIREVSGQLVTPQKMLTIPHAAHNPIGSPKIGAKKLPSVAPINNVGTISPPLNPPPRVTAVKIIFSKKTYHAHWVKKPALITSVPAPR